MDVHLDFPISFVLQNICDITKPVFELKRNPNGALANKMALDWFQRFRVYDTRKAEHWLKSGRFDDFAALSFPDADLSHLETCIMFFLWAFSTDDLSDEGDLQRKPEGVDDGHSASRKILYDPDAPQPCDSPYAAMLWDMLRRIRSTGDQGTFRRFIQAYLQFSASQIQQASNCSLDCIPPVEEFILMRRATIGAALVEAMVEYSLDIDLPEYIFKDPIVIAMSQATTDIMTWPNDLCSFNKEQADGDYQNLVLKEYVDFKQRLPSFGPKVDAALRKYHTALEHFVQGCIVWYYSSPRYFKDVKPLGKKEVVIELFLKKDVA
ncbi:terpenoid synthase [Gymnopus androsaceus JB14]|uniref:Terpene synthase n=1 Tax=Gymnopus androsaceus JB14 TaxID=1447944 RepID=A0A6A4GEF3_9AGAR|nr:terpenoid synthase [Gymnopus androsaceus JB14]